MLLSLSLPFIFFIERNPKYIKIFIILILIPFLSNSLLRLYSITFLFRDSVIINSILDERFSFLYNDRAVLITFIYIYFPYMILPLLSTFQAYNKDFKRIAMDIGMTKMFYNYKIKLPILWNGIFNCFSLVFLLTIGDFLIPQVIGGAKKLYFANIIFNNFTQGLNWSMGAANSIALMLFSILFLFILNFWLKKFFLKKIIL